MGDNTALVREGLKAWHPFSLEITFDGAGNVQCLAHLYADDGEKNTPRLEFVEEYERLEERG